MSSNQGMTLAQSHNLMARPAAGVLLAELQLEVLVSLRAENNARNTRDC